MCAWVGHFNHLQQRQYNSSGDSDQKIFQIWNIWRNQQMISNFDFIFQDDNRVFVTMKQRWWFLQLNHILDISQALIYFPSNIIYHN